MDTISIKYIFTLEDGSQEVFDLKLESRTLVLILKRPMLLPDWTKIEFNQCENCAYDKRKPYCPIAVNLVDLVKKFGKLTSYDRIFVEVITDERSFYKETSAQRGISSLMGLLIATSKCPFTDFFKPMARFHLPFATEEETIWRAISTYLTSQYFLGQDGGKIDLGLKGLSQIYENIQKMNIALARRLRGACERDSTVNAIIVLDVFAKSLPPVIKKSLDKIQPVFKPALRRY